MDRVELALIASPFVLLALGRIPRARPARLLLTGAAILAAAELSLLFWMEHDCGTSGYFGFSDLCDLTPRRLAGALEIPVLLGLLVVPILVALALIAALITEILSRRR